MLWWFCGLLMVLLVACSKKPEGTLLYVAPYPSACIGAGTMACLRVRDTADGNWRVFYGHIDGFDFQPGYDYTLRVKELAGDKGATDPDNKHYQLLSVEQKTSVQDSS
ncbi:MAG: DUF4377 domain-containing protein [Alcanivorax sp.]|nr:DUF4377 domain-containing protein [Alcanivorax sp.]